MCRLPQLLRYFRLPPNATAADVRQAYLKRVKQVHPDTNSRAASQHAFQELQCNFKEACDLLEEARAPWDLQKHAHRSAQTSHANYQFKEHSFNQHEREWSNTGDFAPHPVQGLPTTTVYPLAMSLFAATAASFWLSQRQQPSPSAAEAHQKSRPEEKPLKPDTTSGGRQFYSALTSGPWNVAVAKAGSSVQGVWAPSKAAEYLESESFYNNRTRGHLREGISQRTRLGESQGKQIKDLGYMATHQPQVRRGVEMLPVHTAAEDGNIWWLEHCGANSTCRGMLNMLDAHKDTPLHHCAQFGQLEACRTLLRLGVDPSAQNSQLQLPEELAAKSGFYQLADLLHAASAQYPQFQLRQEMPSLFAQHPDGHGCLVEPPEGVVFTGLDVAEIPRRAVNMAAGCSILPPLPITRAMHEHRNAAERISNIVQGSLQSTEFDLEEVVLKTQSKPTVGFSKAEQNIWIASGENVEVCGLLLYEPPGSVTADAPGHWIAVRRWLNTDGPSEGIPGSLRQVKTTDAMCFRLDPVRGPFQITVDELEELVSRYPAWRVVRGSAQLRALRTLKSAETRSEAEKCLQARGG